MEARLSRLPTIVAAALLVLAVLLALPSVGRARAADLSASYQSPQKLPAGTIVVGDAKDSKNVFAANTKLSNILGVVVSSSTVVVGQTNAKVEVTNNGQTNVLVSDINGAVTKGDKITVSPLDGIGMRASVSGIVVGTAQASLNYHAGDTHQATVTDAQGHQRTINVGSVPVVIGIGDYQAPAPPSVLPHFITNLANLIGGRAVSTGRLLASFFIMLVGLAIVVILLTGGVHSSIGAIGRNPLAKRAIQRSLGVVLGLAALILFVSSTISFMILKG